MSINIYGAGIAGLSLAASLSENHFENYKIFEKASDIRKSETAIQLGFNCFQAHIVDLFFHPTQLQKDLHQFHNLLAQLSQEQHLLRWQHQ